MNTGFVYHEDYLKHLSNGEGREKRKEKTSENERVRKRVEEVKEVQRSYWTNLR